MHSAHTQRVCLQGAVNECTPYSTVSTLALGFLPSNSVNSCPVHFYRQTVSTLALFISTFKQCYLLPCSFLPSNSVISCLVHFYLQCTIPQTPGSEVDRKTTMRNITSEYGMLCHTTLTWLEMPDGVFCLFVCLLGACLLVCLFSRGRDQHVF
jgi:hypothetical protein